MALLGEYAADIIPALLCPYVKWKNHVMLYHHGANAN